MQSVTVSEPRFTPDEVELLLSSRRDENRPRGAHGYTIAEATDPKNRGRFHVSDPLRDYAQQAVDQAREKYRKTWGEDAEMGSLYFRAELLD